VMGAYMVLHPRARITVLIFFFFILLRQFPAKFVLGVWFVYQVFMALVGGIAPGSGGGVAFLAHVGGFGFGYLLLRGLLKMKGRGSGPTGEQRVYRVHW
jgi:membrane associated rhomboid family serine protease